MERKRIITIGVDGPPLSADISSRLTWISLGPSRGVGLVGLEARDETDIDVALEIGLKEGGSSRRISIRESSIDVKMDGPILDWESLFGADIQLLQPGDILVSAEIAKIYERKFLFEKVEEDRELYFLRGERRRPERLRGLSPNYSPLVGRLAETRKLEELLEQICVDQGQIAGIVGEAGIGKTRLTAHLKDLLSKKAIAYAEGKYSPGVPNPYEGFRQIAQGLLGANTSAMTRWSMTEAETDYLRLFLDPGTKIDRLSSMTEEEIRQGLYYSVRKLIHSAAKTPFVLILEDLHFADSASLELLEYILEGVEETRLLIVLVHRPDLEIKWGKRLNYNEFRLTPLSEEEIDHLATSTLKVDQISPSFKTFLAQRSLGNALFLEELLRQWKESGLLQIDFDDHGKSFAMLKKGAEKSLPTTLHSLIATRFDQLDADLRNALCWASLLGIRFNGDEFERLLSEQQFEDAPAKIKKLFEKNYLSERSIFPRKIYQFTHDLIFEVVLQSLTTDEAHKRHQQIGDFLSKYHSKNLPDELDRIADHFLLGIHTSQTIRILLQAGEKALFAHQIQRALHLFKRAEAIWRKIRPKEISLQVVYPPLIRMLVMIGELDRAGNALEAWDSFKENATVLEEGHFARLQMMYFNAISDFSSAFDASERALKAFAQSKESESEFYEMMHDRLSALMNLGRRDQVMHEGLARLNELNDGRYPLVRMRLWSRMAFCITSTGNAEHALQYLQRATSLITQETPISLQLEASNRYCMALDQLGQFKESVALRNRQIELARENGLRQLLIKCILERGHEALDSGHFSQAILDFQEALVTAKEIYDESIEMRSIAGTIETFVALGLAKEAETWWTSHRERFEKTENPWTSALTCSLQGAVDELNGRYENAAQSLRKASTHWKEAGNEPARNHTLMCAFRMEAERNLRPAQTLAQEFTEFLKNEPENSLIDYRFHLTATAMMISMAGGDLEDVIDMRLKPSECPWAGLRQRTYLANIQWLAKKGQTTEAQKLSFEYKKDRETLAEKVPTEHRQAFLNHILLRVPTI